MKPKGWRNESRRHGLSAKGIKTAQKIPKMPKNPKPTPFEYQDKNQEKIIHSSWEYGHSYRFVLEGTGDIFRELTKADYDYGYIDAKIRRIEHHFRKMEEQKEFFPKTKIHPEDSIQFARDENPEKFKKMIEQWENQPYSDGLQKTAIELNLAMLKGHYGKAKKLVKELRKVL